MVAFAVRGAKNDLGSAGPAFWPGRNESNPQVVCVRFASFGIDL
jgi:hypothetical protein